MSQSNKSRQEAGTAQWATDVEPLMAQDRESRLTSQTSDTKIQLPVESTKTPWEDFKQMAVTFLPAIGILLVFFLSSQPTRKTRAADTDKLVAAIGNLTLEIRSLKDALLDRQAD